MAGDWIKMRSSNLWDDPRIARLCDTTDQPEAMTVSYTHLTLPTIYSV